MIQQQIYVEYLDHMGSDLTVVNAARTSFGKESTWVSGPGGFLELSKADESLIGFLARGFRTKEWDALADEFLSCNDGDRNKMQQMLTHFKKSAQHWAPFAHPHLQIRMTLPIFLARQFVKHQIGGVWSEESRRYMSSEPTFWFPNEWHARPEDIKQGSDGLVADPASADTISRYATGLALAAYTDMLDLGVAPEEARTVLPLNTMTTVTWTGSLLFWSRVANQRLDTHAQKAANELAGLLSGIVGMRYPVSWKALVGV